MSKVQRSELRLAGERRGHTWVHALAVMALLVAPAACAHAKGESQLPWLEKSLESEFPDHGSPPVGDLLGGKRVETADRPPAAAPSPAAPVANSEPSDVAPSGLALAPLANTPADDSQNTASRPVIRIVGSGRPHAAGRGVDDHIEVTLPDEHATGAVGVGGAAMASGAHLVPGSTVEHTAKQEYDRGLALLNAHDFDHALGAFSAFLVRYPDDPAAEAAMFWSGECYVAKGDLVEAADQFESTLARFPQGTKVPDALLRLGVTEQRLGNQDKARGAFERLTREFPKSDATRRIPREHGVTL